MKKKKKKVIKKVVKKITEKPKEITDEKVKKIKIRVIGIGGGGGSIVSEIAPMVEKATFFAADTDLKALRGFSRNVEKFQFGQNFTSGLGTGMNPGIAREAAKKEREKIKKILEGQDLIIFIASLGGGVGGGRFRFLATLQEEWEF